MSCATVGRGGMELRGLIVALVATAAAAACGLSAAAQAPACRYFKVQANTVNVSKEARDNAVFIDILDKGEIACVTRDQKVGDSEWGYFAHKVIKPGQNAPVEGWTNLRQLAPLSPAEVATITGTAAPAAPANAPADDVPRFSAPI